MGTLTVVAGQGSLLARARARETSAWEELYSLYRAGLYRHARFLCGDPSLAEEVVQDVFVQAALSIDRFEGASSLETWLHGIALNLVRAQRRKRRNRQVAHARLKECESLLRTDGPAPDAALVTQQKAAALFAALETLPDQLREAFVLRDLEGLAPHDAAARLGITPNNLSVRASRARAKLSVLLAAFDEETSGAA